MSNNEENIRDIFSQSINSFIHNCDELAPVIANASHMIAGQLLEGGKIFCCGNGGDASDAQYFTSCFLNRFDRERPSLPAICLSADATTMSAIANDQNFNDVYAKQLKALAQAGDVLLVISTQGNSSSLVQAVQTAHEKSMFIIAINSDNTGDIGNILNQNDIELRIQSHSNATENNNTTNNRNTTKNDNATVNTIGNNITDNRNITKNNEAPSDSNAKNSDKAQYNSRARIKELSVLILNCLSEQVDRNLFGG